MLLVFVRSLAFCNLVPSVQANIWPPGTLSHCEYGVVLVLPLLSLISGILGQDRSTTSGVGRLSG